MEFLKDFGFDPVLFIAQIINFLIILFILKKMLYKPVLDMIKKREDEIKKGLSDSEEAEKLLTKATEKETQILQKAQARAEKIMGEAREEATALKVEIEKSGRRESERMISVARVRIAQENREAEERLTKKIGEIAVRLLERSLQGVFGKSEQKTILKKAKSQLERQTSL